MVSKITSALLKKLQHQLKLLLKPPLKQKMISYWKIAW